MTSYRYRVYFTPLQDADGSVYGDEIDVSDRVEVSGIGSIKKGIDAADYQVGVFYFQDIVLKAFNYNGYFNDGDDTRSIFISTRDRCKVRIVYEEVLITRSSSGVQVGDATVLQTATFMGIINEEGTRLDPTTDAISFVVLSLDSVLRTTTVSGGLINNGDLASDAIFAILNQPRITSVLTLSALNINPDYDFIIDDATDLTNTSVKEALDNILKAANSILFINRSNEIIVKDRTEDTVKPIINLYGKSDEHGRENIIKIKDYNSGLHRTITAFRINDTLSEDAGFSQSYGYREKGFDFNFITNPDTEATIGERFLSDFSSPKIELIVEVPTRVVKDVEPLDRVSINYPLRVTPPPGNNPKYFLPVIGITEIGDTEMPLPYVFGSVSIMPNIGFKVVEIVENPKDFTSSIKLRQIGPLVFNTPNNCIVGYAKIDEAVICVGGTPCDTYERSVIGAAKIGCSILNL